MIIKCDKEVQKEAINTLLARFALWPDMPMNCLCFITHLCDPFSQYLNNSNNVMKTNHSAIIGKSENKCDC